MNCMHEELMFKYNYCFRHILNQKCEKIRGGFRKLKNNTVLTIFSFTEMKKKKTYRNRYTTNFIRIRK